MRKLEDVRKISNRVIDAEVESWLKHMEPALDTAIDTAAKEGKKMALIDWPTPISEEVMGKLRPRLSTLYPGIIIKLGESSLTASWGIIEIANLHINHYNIRNIIDGVTRDMFGVTL